MDVCVKIVEPFDTISIIHHNSIIAISPIKIDAARWHHKSQFNNGLITKLSQHI